MNTKKIIAWGLCAVLALSLAACGGSKPIGGDPAAWGPQSQPASGVEDALQPASPFKPCDTLEQAAELAGFEVTLPGAADALEAVEGQMIQAFYGPAAKTNTQTTKTSEHRRTA